MLHCFCIWTTIFTLLNIGPIPQLCTTIHDHHKVNTHTHCCHTLVMLQALYLTCRPMHIIWLFVKKLILSVGFGTHCIYTINTLLIFKHFLKCQQKTDLLLVTRLLRFVCFFFLLKGHFWCIYVQHIWLWYFLMLGNYVDRL